MFSNAAFARDRPAIRPKQCMFMSAPDTQPLEELQDLDYESGPGEANLRGRSAAPRYADLVLPPADTKRWSSRRKAAVIVAMLTGVITRQQACERYLLSGEELAAWETAFERRGITGLLVTRRSKRSAVRIKS
jgi:Protein of unknown function (DUF1153)